MKKALFDVQSLMNVVQADLPMTGANLKPSWVLAIDPLNLPVLSLSVTGGGYDPMQLRTLVENARVNRLKVVKDVPSVVPFGGEKLQMQVIVDRERLAAYRMSLLDVRNALDMQNLSRPAGTLTFHAGAHPGGGGRLSHRQHGRPRGLPEGRGGGHQRPPRAAEPVPVQRQGGHG